MKAEAILDHIRVIQMEREEGKRTVYCAPEVADAVTEVVEVEFAGLQWTVVSSPACPPDRLYVIDHGAVEAGQREMMQEILNRPLHWGTPKAPSEDGA